MFVQVIEGRVRDAEGLRSQWQSWMQELAPSAIGWLGSTAGITADDRFIAAVRFESAEAAAENSNRSQQSQWWASTEKTLEDVSFHDSSDYSSSLGEGSDDAGFVQIMHGRAVDRRRLEELDAAMEETLPEHRPDVIGGYQIWLPGDEFVAVNYFTSEEEARAGEAKELPGDLAERFSEWLSLMQDVRWYDLSEPWLDSPS